MIYKFQKIINRFCINEGLGSLVPTAQNVKKEQNLDNRLGRWDAKLNNFVDTINKMGDAAWAGDTRGFINAINNGLLKRNEIITKSKARQLLLSKNFLKDVKVGDKILIYNDDSIFDDIRNKFENIRNLNKNIVEFVVSYVNKIQYRDPHADNLEQLWGQIYCTVLNKKLRQELREKGIGYLYISFNAENVTNQGNVSWINADKQYIPEFNQKQKSFEKVGDDIRIVDLHGTNPYKIEQEFKLNINQQNPIFKSEAFNGLLYFIVNQILLNNNYRNASTETTNAIYRRFTDYFNKDINPTDNNTKFNPFTVDEIKQYFTTNNDLRAISNNMSTRDLFNEIISNYEKNL